MKLGEWYNIDYEAQGKETKYWLLPLKVSGPNSLVAAIEIPTGRLTTHFTFAFINKYGKLKKKPEDVKVNYRLARNAMKAIFGS